jgi:hypothetical protein
MESNLSPNFIEVAESSIPTINEVAVDTMLLNTGAGTTSSADTFEFSLSDMCIHAKLLPPLKIDANGNR